jgi:hypothetical protein
VYILLRTSSGLVIRLFISERLIQITHLLKKFYYFFRNYIIIQMFAFWANSSNNGCSCCNRSKLIVMIFMYVCILLQNIMHQAKYMKSYRKENIILANIDVLKISKLYRNSKENKRRYNKRAQSRYSN